MKYVPVCVDKVLNFEEHIRLLISITWMWLEHKQFLLWVWTLMWLLCWMSLECDWNTQNKLRFWATMLVNWMYMYYVLIGETCVLQYYIYLLWAPPPYPFPLIKHWLIAGNFLYFFFIFSFLYFCIICCLKTVQNNLICQISTVQWYGFFFSFAECTNQFQI